MAQGWPSRKGLDWFLHMCRWSLGPLWIVTGVQCGGGTDLHALLALTPFGPLCGRSGVGAEMANENHGSPREEASLLSHSPGTSNQSQPCSPKPVRLVQDLPGTGEGQWLGGGVGRVPGSSLDPGWAPCLLAEELVHAGWEKCWSRRENRPYYFNRFTNQSLWEMPVLGQHDVIVSASLGQGSWRLLASGPSPNVPRAAITYLALCQDLGTQCQARQTQSCPHGTYTSVGETDT